MRRRHVAAALLCAAAVSCGRGPEERRAPVSPPAPAPASPPAPPPVTGSALENVEERKGPFTIGGQPFTVHLLIKRLPGRSDADSQALDTLDIRDGAGRAVFHETFSHEVENGQFREWCGAGVEPLTGSAGSGLLVTSECLPSAPSSGGPWEVFGVVRGTLMRFGKPVVASGTFGRFVPGAVIARGAITETRSDTFTIRLWTGYFFVTVPIRIDWIGGSLALAQRCMTQSGRGFVDDGCELPPEEATLAPRDAQTFVRLFRESNEDSGPPAHVVVNPASTVEVVGSKVRVRWNEQPDVVVLAAGDDVWVQVRIDGRTGWIHTEDLGAIGLNAAG